MHCELFQIILMYKEIMSKYIKRLIRGDVYKKGQGKLVVIYENGWVEPIQKFDLPIIIFVQYAGIQKISLPYYAPYSLGAPANVAVYKTMKKLLKVRRSYW